MGGKGSGRKNAGSDFLAGSNVDGKTNSKVIRFGIDILKIKNPDLSDPDDIERAFTEFLEMCDKHEMRPMVQSLASVFGIDRQAFWGISNNIPKYDNFRGGILTPESRATIKKCYDFLAVIWESSLIEEKGNPVKWIFLAKNHFGYKDQTEQVQVRVDAKPALPEPDDVMAKYAARLGQPAPSLDEPEEIEVIE